MSGRSAAGPAGIEPDGVPVRRLLTRLWGVAIPSSGSLGRSWGGRPESSVVLCVFLQRRRRLWMQRGHDMPAGNDNWAPEALLQHASSIKRLARRLVGDADEAEDLVQDTWSAALAFRPATDRSLRPWLATVLRNFARRSQRRAAARPVSDAEAVLGSAVDADPSDTCEGIEAARLLTEEVGRLPEPYRSALYLRYYQDLSPTDIARRLGLPPATVRSQLKRGLERLRERLDGRFDGNPGAWSVLLLPLTRSTSTAASFAAPPAIATTGILAMNAWLKLGAALAAAAVLYFTGALTGVLPDNLSIVSPTEAGEGISALPGEPSEQERADSVPATRAAPSPRRVALAAAAPEPQAAPVPVERTAFIEAVIRDEQGGALPNAQLSVRMGPDASEAGASILASADGRALLELAVDEDGEQVTVEASAPGFVSVVDSVQLRRGETARLGTLMLIPGGGLSGVVVDERGRRVEGALITVDSSGRDPIQLEFERHLYVEDDEPAQAGQPPFALTDHNGSFRLIGVPERYVRIWARAVGHAPVYSDPVSVGTSPDPLELVLETLRRENSVTGVVVDPEGEPVPHAMLNYKHESIELQYSRRTRKSTGADGTFRFLLEQGMRLSITASDPEDRGGPVTVELEAGVEDLVLRLSDGKDISLVVLEEGSGKELDEFEFTILAASGEEVLQSGQGINGVASFRLPESDFRVVVSARLHSEESLGPIAPSATPSTCRMRLAKLSGLRGQVTANGEPVAGATVRLHRLVDEATRYEHRGVRCWVSPLVLDQAVTDQAGGFLLDPRSAGDYVVQVESEGHALAEHGPLSLGRDLRMDPLAIQLAAGGAIEGRVTIANDGDPTGTVVGIHRGDGRVQTLRVDADGSFRFALLTPGQWHVGVSDATAAVRSHSSSVSTIPFDDEVKWSCSVSEGQTTFHDLFVADPRAFVLDGSILVDGASNANMKAFLCPVGTDVFSRQERWDSVVPNPEGRFELAAGVEGDYRLVVQYATRGEMWMILDTIHVGPDMEPWEHELATGTLEIVGIGAPPAGQDMPPFLFLWNGPGELTFLCLPMPTSDICTMRIVPAGEGTLVRPTLQSILDLRGSEVLLEFEVPPGETTRVRAP